MYISTSSRLYCDCTNNVGNKIRPGRFQQLDCLLLSLTSVIAVHVKLKACACRSFVIAHFAWIPETFMHDSFVSPCITWIIRLVITLITLILGTTFMTIDHMGI